MQALFKTFLLQHMQTLWYRARAYSPSAAELRHSLTTRHLCSQARSSLCMPCCVQEMKIERVEDMLDDIREQGDQLTQIQDAMRQPLGYAPDVDESELEAELEVSAALLLQLLLPTRPLSSEAEPLDPATLLPSWAAAVTGPAWQQRHAI